MWGVYIRKADVHVPNHLYAVAYCRLRCVWSTSFAVSVPQRTLHCHGNKEGGLKGIFSSAAAVRRQQAKIYTCNNRQLPLPSLVLSPFHKKGEGLVHTVCACAGFYGISPVLLWRLTKLATYTNLQPELFVSSHSNYSYRSV